MSTDLKVGDRVTLHATITQISDGEVAVELDDDGREMWVDGGRVELDLPTGLREEPPDGTWLHVEGGPEHDGTVLHREDDPAADDVGRRYPRRWRDYGAGEFIDWPEAVRRGADPDKRLERAVVKQRRARKPRVS